MHAAARQDDLLAVVLRDGGVALVHLRSTAKGLGGATEEQLAERKQLRKQAAAALAVLLCRWSCAQLRDATSLYSP